MTIDLTRQGMIDRIIEEQYDGMDYKALWHFFEWHQQREYADYKTEEIETEYKELFSEEEE
jgi:hypothetical protein